MSNITGFDILAAVLLIILIAPTRYLMRCWYLTIRFYGRGFAFALLCTFNNSMKTRRLWGVVLGVGAPYLAARDFEARGLTLAGLLGCCVGFFCLANTWLPPSAVFLGTIRGQERQISLFRRQDEKTPILRKIQVGLMPLRMIHFQERATDQASFYIGGNAHWLAVVFSFLIVVPIIIVDARVATRAVLIEAEFIVRHDEVRANALFITDPDGTSAVLDALRTKMGADFVDVHAVLVGDVLHEVAVRKRGRLPAAPADRP